MKPILSNNRKSLKFQTSMNPSMVVVSELADNALCHTQQEGFSETSYSSVSNGVTHNYDRTFISPYSHVIENITSWWCEIICKPFTFYNYFLIIITHKVIYTMVCIRKNCINEKLCFSISYANNSVCDSVKFRFMELWESVVSWALRCCCNTNEYFFQNFIKLNVY